jgi:hypothetical protein
MRRIARGLVATVTIVASVVAPILSVGLAACGRSDGPKPLIATADDVSAKPTTSATASSPPLDATPPMFTYVDGDDRRLLYWSSGASRVVVGGRSCESALGENDNMWTRPDVDAAFHDPDVLAALARHAFFQSAYPTQAEIVAPEGKIDWWNSWDKPPPPEPKAVGHVHEVLHVVLENRVSLCK